MPCTFISVEAMRDWSDSSEWVVCIMVFEHFSFRWLEDSNDRGFDSLSPHSPLIAHVYVYVRCFQHERELFAIRFVDHKGEGLECVDEPLLYVYVYYCSAVE